MLRFSILKRLGALCALAGTFSVGSASHAATIVIDQDTVIDASNSFPNDRIEIVDGSSPPTHVDLIGGGEVRGFAVTNNSTLDINGGSSTFWGEVQDNAKLIMRSGSIECTTLMCSVIDLISIVDVEDNGSLHVYGGTIVGPIALEPSATAHFYGRDLTLSIFPEGGIVEGKLASGEPAYFSLFTQAAASQIFLHQVPEPRSVFIFAGIATFLLLTRT